MADTFLGEDLLSWLVLAIGGALIVGNVLALVRPPATTDERALEQAPLVRTLVQIVIGMVATVWALATLLA